MRKIIAFIFAIIFSFSVACGSGLFAQNYAIINQYDVAFRTSEYSYCGHYFWENGCGPSSVANALIAGLGITDEEVAADVLSEVMWIMAGNPRRNNIDVKRYIYLPSQGETLQFLYDEGGWNLICYDYIITTEVLKAATSKAPALLFSKANNEKRWETVIQYAQVLKGTGATIYMVRVGTGTSSVRGPLVSGTAGHYVTLAIPVDEFLENGTIYLLDSAPRALANEAYGKDCYYKSRYPFVSNPRGHREFLNTYGIERVQEDVIRFYLLNPVETNRLAAANMFTLYGAFFWFITIP